MNQTLNIDREDSNLYPLDRTVFLIAGGITSGQYETLKAVEKLFFIRFLEHDNVNASRESDIAGKIVFLPEDIRNINNTAFALNAECPNLIMNLNEANIQVFNHMLNKQVSGTVQECRDYLINSDAEAFGPLKGARIKERDPRNIFVFTPDTGMKNLIASRDSCVFGAYENIYFTTVGLAEIHEKHGLKDEFDDLCFMGLLPLFFFLRRCMGDQFFKPANIGACCIVDDGNIRLPRYGYMKYFEVALSAQMHNYHIAIAMVPIDYKKAGKKALKIFHENERYLSVMMHGNNHLKHEMLVDMSRQEKTRILEQALWRMHQFSKRTDLKWTRTMVFPHDKCSKDTISLMRRCGYQAAFMQTPYPNDMRDGKNTPHTLFDLYPSENSVEGFPVITRQSLEGHYMDHDWYNQILFHAWLGKPIIPWTHHYFFRNGLEEIEEKIHHINSHISPEWTDMSGVLNNNYTIAKRNSSVYIHAYSNVLLVELPEHTKEVTLAKHGCGLLNNDETLMVNGRECDWNHKSNNYLSAVIKTEGQQVMDVNINSVSARLNGRRHRTGYYAYVRRCLSEIRDQTEPYTRLKDEFINKRVFRK